jgi:hypothetical protein
VVTKIKQGVIGDAAVGGTQLAGNAVTTDKVALDTLTAADLAPDSVGSSEIAADSVGADELAPEVTPSLTKSFESSQQTITAAALLTLAHGLAVAPKLVQAEIVCVTGEFNWVAGDRLVVSCGANCGSADNRGLGVYHDATNVYVRIGSNANSLVIVNKTNGNAALMTNANWRLVIRAFS